MQIKVGDKVEFTKDGVFIRGLVDSILRGNEADDYCDWRHINRPREVACVKVGNVIHPIHFNELRVLGYHPVEPVYDFTIPEHVNHIIKMKSNEAKTFWFNESRIQTIKFKRRFYFALVVIAVLLCVLYKCNYSNNGSNNSEQGSNSSNYIKHTTSAPVVSVESHFNGMDAFFTSKAILCEFNNFTTIKILEKGDNFCKAPVSFFGLGSTDFNNLVFSEVQFKQDSQITIS